jgi:hypothetical protein
MTVKVTLEFPSVEASIAALGLLMKPKAAATASNAGALADAGTPPLPRREDRRQPPLLPAVSRASRAPTRDNSASRTGRARKLEGRAHRGTEQSRCDDGHCARRCRTLRQRTWRPSRRPPPKATSPKRRE